MIYSNYSEFWYLLKANVPKLYIFVPNRLQSSPILCVNCYLDYLWEPLKAAFSVGKRRQVDYCGIRGTNAEE